MPVAIWLIMGLYLLGNFYVYIRGGQALSNYPTGVKVLLSVLFWSGAFAFFFTFLFRKAQLSTKVMMFTHEVGSGWLVFTLYMVLWLFLFDLVRLFHKPFTFGFHLALAFTLCLLGYGYYMYKNPVIRTMDLVINKNAEPSQIKVVAVSDIHLGFGTGKKALSSYVDKINEQKPDLILISGDLIDNGVDLLKREQMEEELNRLNAPLGVYMALGNHEYISGILESEAFIRSTDIQLLCDSIVVLPNGIQLIGRDDRHNPARESLDVLLASADKNKPMILLDHQPFDLDRTVHAGVDLQFSGHTHRGQVWPINLLTDRLFELSYGYDKRENTHLYVSSGLSLWGPPFRIGSQSEMVVFNLTFD